MIKLLKLQHVLFFILLVFVSINILAQNTTVQENDIAAEKYLNEGNKAEAARLYNQSAYLLRTEGNPKEAITYYKKVLDLNTELGNTVGQVLTHSNLSMLYIETEEYNTALVHLKAELKAKEQSKKIEEIIPVLVTIASVYNEMDRFNEAVENAQRAIDYSKELNNMELLKRSYGVMYDTYNSWGKQEEAASFFELYSVIDKKIKEDRMAEIENDANQKVSAAYTEKAITEQALDVTSKELEKTVETLEEAERIKKEQQMALDLQEAKINEQNALLRVNRLKITIYFSGVVFLLLFVFLLVFFLVRLRKANVKINDQRSRLEKQNREIRSSIRYGHTIQTAMLIDLSEINKIAGSHFVIWRPKDIVSGDFYWASVLSETRMFFAIVDCTGHGVPGAFMSMIGMRMLNEIVNKMRIDSPAQILETLNNLLREALRQEQTDNNDGMDLAICRIDRFGDDIDLVFSGAKRPLYIGRNNKSDIEMLKPDRKSIGGYQPAKRYIEFTDQKVKLQKGDNIYMFSDGIVDQNNPSRKKFGRARLESILSSCMDESVEVQKDIIETKLDEFIKTEAQRDDITFAGLKFI